MGDTSAQSEQFVERKPLHEVYAPHCTTPFSPLPVSSALSDGTLPYRELGGPGFERLCYELLIAERKSARFFGVSGQSQYGVDLVSEDPDGTTVYQCKNVAGALTPVYLRNVVETFEREWVQGKGLPAPTRFVLCCPHDLPNEMARDGWQKLQLEFHARTEVRLGAWFRTELDTRLRSLPDVVADMFSRRQAESFCRDIDDWRSDIFWPVNPSGPSPRRLRRFFERQASARIYVNPEYERAFIDALEDRSVVLVRGPAGTGKTVTATALSCAFQAHIRRVYYLSLGDTAASVDQIVLGLRRRLSRPIVAIIDEAHLGRAIVEAVVDRLQVEIARADIAIVLLARHVPAASEWRGDEWQLANDLSTSNAVIDVSVDIAYFRGVVEALRPDFEGLSPERLDRLESLTASDLLLTDELLSTLSKPSEIDGMILDDLLKRVRTHYFSGSSVYLPTLARIAAVGQFDVKSPASMLSANNWQNGEEEIASYLVVMTGQDAEYQFAHSSLAALVFRALVPRKDAALATRDFVLAHLRLRQPAERDRDLNRILRTSPRLFTPDEERMFKAQLLAHDDLMQIAAESHHLSLLTALTLTARAYDVENVGAYSSRLAAALAEDLHGRGLSRWAMAALKAMQKLDVRIAGDLARDAGLTDLPTLIARNGTIKDLCDLGCMFQDQAKGLFTGLDDQSLSRLLTNSMTRKERFVFIASAIRALSRVDESLGRELIDRFSSRHTAWCAAESSSISDFIRLVVLLGPEQAVEGLQLLDAETIKSLVQGEMQYGNLGVLHFSMYELSKAAPEVRTTLEALIAPADLLELIWRKGTLFDLTKLLSRLTPAQAARVASLVDNELAEQLVNGVLAGRRSIGTMGLHLMTIRQASPGLATMLTERIGPTNFVKLFGGAGTIVDMCKLIQYMELRLSEHVLNLLTDSDLDRIAARTVASGRSIGTLNWTLKLLRKTSAQACNLLEKRMGADRLLRVIECNGTLFEFYKLVEDTNPSFGRTLVDQVSDETLNLLVNKTIATEQSIGTIDWTFSNLQKSAPDLATALESRIGPRRFATLITHRGSVQIFLRLAATLTAGTCLGLLECLTTTDVRRMLERSVDEQKSIGSLQFSFAVVRRRDETAALALERLVTVQGAWELIQRCGTVGAIAGLLPIWSPSFSSAFVSAGGALTETDWRLLLQRGNFFDVVLFLCKCDSFLQTPEISSRVSAAIAATAQGITEASEWYPLDTGSLMLGDVRRKEIQLILRSALIGRLRQIDLAALQFDSFREACRAVACLGRALPEMLSVLATRLSSMLPEEDKWMQSPADFFGHAPALIMALQAEEFNAEQRLRVFRIAICPETLTNLSTTPADEGFLYIWSLYCLWHARLKEWWSSFDSVLPSTSRETVVQYCKDRFAKSTTGGELVGLLALFGMLQFIDPKLVRRIARPVPEALNRAKRYLVRELVGKDFVHAFFGLGALRTLFPDAEIVTPLVDAQLLALANDKKNLTAVTLSLAVHVRGFRPKRH